MISVVLTTYNGEKYIIDQLDSIVNQSIKPNEILIGDDNSTDSTLDLIFDYLKNKNINYYINDEGINLNNVNIIVRIFKNSKNIGYNKNFINLIKKTSYDIIFISDQDDIWYKDKIKIQTEVLNNTNAICVASKYDLVNNGDKIIINTDYDKISIKNINHISFYGMTMCFKKDDEFISFIDSIKNDETYMYYDRLFTLYFLINGNVYFINNPLVYHRIHNSNAVGNNTKVIRGTLEDRVNVAYDYYNDIILIKKYIKNLNKINNIYLNKNENFRYKRYILLNELYKNNSIKNKIKLLFFIITNFYNYPFLKSILGDLYYIFKR